MKESRGGKYVSPDFGTPRHFTPKEVGQKMRGKKGEEGQRLGFKGSNLQSFTYYDPKTDTYVTFQAHNAKEASRVAKSQGLQLFRDEKRKKR